LRASSPPVQVARHQVAGELLRASSLPVQVARHQVAGELLRASSPPPCRWRVTRWRGSCCAPSRPSRALEYAVNLDMGEGRAGARHIAARGK